MPAFKLSHRLIRDCRVQGLSDCWLLADEKGKPIPGMVATSVLYYCAPVVQRSTTAYQHLKELEEVGFVVSERQGRSKVYRTTGRFSEYFGLSREVALMKRQLEGRSLTLQ